jgi:hypothetical protein
MRAMTAFEFVFSFFGLVLGLSVAEILTGFARVLREHGKIRLGWLTPLLGLILLVDLITFWTNAWAIRDSLPASFVVLAFGMAIAGVYFLAASLVFPIAAGAWPDLDHHFMRNKALVIGGVIAANWLMTLGLWLLFGNPFHDWAAVAMPIAFTAPGLALIFAKSTRVCLLVELTILILYVVNQFV